MSEDVKKDDSGAAPAKETFEIENLVAIDNVHLVAPGQNLHARNRLDAVFAPDPDIVRAGATKSAKPATTVAPASPKLEIDAQSGGDEKPKSKPEPEKPPEPSAKAVADRVWALVGEDRKYRSRWPRR